MIAVTAYYGDWNVSNRQPIGGGIFVAKAQSTPMDDGGMFIRPNAAWLWVRVLDVAGTVSPYMFGAKVTVFQRMPLPFRLLTIMPVHRLSPAVLVY
ncbi:hypothetical protein M8494_08415 [Serratia ureilytica]